MSIIGKKEIVKIKAVGDVMLGDFPACYGFGVDSFVKKEGPLFPFRLIKKSLGGSDLLFGNLESILSPKGRSLSWLPTLYMRGRQESVLGLKDCGFDVMSISNNHMMQHGAAAFEDTAAILEGEGIFPLGLKGEGKSTTPYITEMKGYKIGFLGYSLRPEEYCPGDELYCRCDNEELIVNGIRALKAEVDFIFVSLHWGNEYIPKPSPQQIDIGHRLIDEGAHVIIGHHPHVLQGVERYKSGLIAYSLGNFIFDMWMPLTKKSVILEVTLAGEGVVDYDIVPVRINDFYQPEVLNSVAEDKFREEFNVLCNHISHGSYTAKEYAAELEKAFKEYRQSVKNHYIKNYWRYNSFYFLQLLLLIFWRRVARKHL